MIETPFLARERTPRSHFYIYHFQTAFGDIYETSSLKLFAREFGVKQEGMSDLVSGRIRVYKGFRFIGKTNQEFRMIDPNGVEHVVDHIKEFASKHGINTTSLYHIYRGIKKSAKGWKPSVIPPMELTEGYVRQVA